MAGREPFGIGWQAYIERGWPGVLPVGFQPGGACQPRRKATPPPGFTGETGSWPTHEDLVRWASSYPFLNIGLRLPDGVVGLDVDQYESNGQGPTKRGASIVQELERRHGPLPPTWRSTSRGRSDPSGVRLYRVPAGTRLRTGVPGGLDLIQHHHRYLCVWPSLHPDPDPATGTARLYQWYGPDGDRTDEPPAFATDDIPELPWRWIDALAAPPGPGPAPARFPMPAPQRAELSDWSPRVREYFDEAHQRLARAGAGGRHDTACSVACGLARYEQLGQRGATSALDRFGALFIDAVTPDRGTEPGQGRRAAEAEWASIVRSGRQKVQVTVATGSDGGDGHEEQPAGPQPPLAHTRQPAADQLASRRLATPGALSDGLRATHVANAERMVRAHGEHLRFVPDWRQWLVWDGARWVEDPADVQVSRLAKDVARGLFRQVPTIADSEERKRMFTWAHRSEMAYGIASTVKLARSVRGIALDHEALDPDPLVLNTPNGLVDLASGALTDHEPQRMCTRITSVAYDASAACPAFTRFLEQILPDPQVQEYVRRFVGYCLTGDVSEQVFAIWHGDGANGKSTLLDLIRRMLGGYCVSVPRELLSVQRHEHHDTKYVDLFRARLGIRSETKYGGRLDEERVKMLTGGDRIKARRMREDYWEFDPTAKLVLATNHRPEIKGADHAIWRRIHLVPFDVTIPEWERDRLLGRRLAETELPGILSWAIKGCLEWRDRGLDPPDAVRSATAAYRTESDLAARFFEEAGLRFEPEAWERSAVLVSAHRSWCDENSLDHHLEWPKALAALRARGAIQRTRSRARGWQGVRLGPEPADCPGPAALNDQGATPVTARSL